MEKIVTEELFFSLTETRKKNRTRRERPDTTRLQEAKNVRVSRRERAAIKERKKKERGEKEKEKKRKKDLRKASFFSLHVDHVKLVMSPSVLTESSEEGGGEREKR